MPIIAIIIVVILALGTGAYFYTSKEETETSNARPETTQEVATPVEEPDPVTPPPTRPTTEVGAGAPIETEPVTAIESEPESTIEPEVAVDPEPANQFTDGTYTTQTTYLTPNRSSHSMDITLTVENDIVTDSSIVYDNGSGPSNGHQRRFDAGYKASVIGVPLEDVYLARVSGASLTTESFNEGVDAVETEARI